MGNVKPKKHLGQHFLKDQNIARKIAESVLAKPGESLIEIGPGTGMLTRYLVDRSFDLTLIEVDSESVEALQSPEWEGKFELIEADFLKLDFHSLGNGPHHFTGNLPYNISSPFSLSSSITLRWFSPACLWSRRRLQSGSVPVPGIRCMGSCRCYWLHILNWNTCLRYQRRSFIPRQK